MFSAYLQKGQCESSLCSHARDGLKVLNYILGQMPRMYMHLSLRSMVDGELPRPFIAARGPKSPRKVPNHDLVVASVFFLGSLALSA